MKKRDSLRIAAMSRSRSDDANDRADISYDSVAASAKDLINNFNFIIQEHTRAANTLSRNSKAATGNAKAQEIAQLIKERKKINAGKSRLEPISEGSAAKFPEVQLKKVEIQEKPKVKEESKLESVKLQHIVRNASSNIEYTDFMVEDDEFSLDDIQGELRPSSIAYLRSTSAAQTLEFLEANQDLTSQEIVQKILKEGFGESADSEPGTPMRQGVEPDTNAEAAASAAVTADATA